MFHSNLARIVAVALFAASAWGQTPRPMRTRYLTSLTNPEIEDYLKRNDVIFIPVGTVESMGAFPTDLEYAMAEAYALKMAEEADGLVLPHVIYFYPGVTVTGRGSVYISQETGLAYLKEIAHSLLRQGFRRQIYTSAHGPSNQYVAAMVREFFEETKDPSSTSRPAGCCEARRKRAKLRKRPNPIIFGRWVTAAIKSSDG